MGDKGEEFKNVGPEEMKNLIDEGDIDVEDLENPPGSEDQKSTKVGEGSPDAGGTEDSSSGEYDFTIDVSKYPSGGIIYDFDEIHARGAKVSELKYLDLLNNSGDFTEFHSNLFKVLQNATNVDIRNLTYGDEIPLFIDIRANTYPKGDTFPLMFDCQECNRENKQNFHLANLEFDELDPSYEDPMVYEVDGAKFNLSILRESDILDIEKLISKYIQDEILTSYDFNITSLYTTSLKSASIKEIEGSNLNPNWRGEKQGKRLKEIRKRIELIENDHLSFNQFKVLGAFEEKYSHDIDLDVSIECRFCEEETSLTLPMDREFFYPEDQGINQDNLSDFEV